MNDQIKCSKCQKVTTQDGKSVWVCEDCGTENQPMTQPAPVVDAAAAQAAVDQAAATAATPPVQPTQ